MDQAPADIQEDGTLGDADKAQVTAQTKFRRGGFKPAAEVIAEAGAKGQAPEAPEESSDPIMAEAIAADQSVELEMPEGVTLAGVVPEEPEITPEQAAPKEVKFKIGGREFGTQEEAWAYAEQLEHERLAADAFRQGVEAARMSQPGNSAPQPEIPQEPEEIDPEYYTNPKAYFAKREAAIVARAEAAITQKQQRAQSEQQLWSQFYSDYPDLNDARDFVQHTLEQNWSQLEKVEVKAALKIIAEKSRSRIKQLTEARMPKVTLPKVTQAASPGGGEQVTQPKAKPQALNFAQQMKNLKKNRAQFR